MQQEDIDTYLKFGEFRHGEWFLEGQRCYGGDHTKPLPEGLSDRGKQPADFPEYSHREDINNGCGAQFDGKSNFHQVINNILQLIFII